MASKKELVAAQAFSRRRLTTAFVSGIPGGKELEPSKPMRAVIAGVALSVLLVLGGLIFGMIKPSLPEGWDDNSLIIAQGSGSRYVSVKGVLYPVINTTSARLVIPAGSYKVISLDENNITDVPRGETRGILGAPDALPAANSLAEKTWSACLTAATPGTATSDAGAAAGPPPAGISVVMDPAASYAVPTDKATIVTVDGEPYLVAGGHRYAIQAGESVGIIRALNLESSPQVPVTAQWLSLFPAGSQLHPVEIDGADTQPPNPLVINGTALPVGSIIHIEGTAEDERRILTADGELATLDPFAYRLYLLGSGSGQQTVEVVDSQVGALGHAETKPTPQDWPTEVLQPIEPQDGACALLSAVKGSTAIPTLAVPAPLDPAITYPFRNDTGSLKPGVFVATGSGALVRSMATGDGAADDGGTVDNTLNHGNVYLIDQAGTLFPIPQASSDTLKQLDYTNANLFDIPLAWTNLFKVGPSLSTEAAQLPPAVSAGP